MVQSYDLSFLLLFFKCVGVCVLSSLLLHHRVKDLRNILHRNKISSPKTHKLRWRQKPFIVFTFYCFEMKTIFSDGSIHVTTCMANANIKQRWNMGPILLNFFSQIVFLFVINWLFWVFPKHFCWELAHLHMHYYD